MFPDDITDNQVLAARREVERVVQKITTRNMPWPVRIELLPQNTAAMMVCVRVEFRVWSVDDDQHQIYLMEDARIDPFIVMGTSARMPLSPLDTAEAYIKHKIYEVIKELWKHELHERLLYDGQLWIDPHEGHPLAPGLRENARLRVAARVKGLTERELARAAERECPTKERP